MTQVEYITTDAAIQRHKENLAPTCYKHMTVKQVEHWIGFCYPGLRIKARFAPLEKGDVTIPNLRREFEQLNKEWPLYDTFEDFLAALQIFIPGEFAEDGIFTNLRYWPQALGWSLKHMLSCNEK